MNMEDLVFDRAEWLRSVCLHMKVIELSKARTQANAVILKEDCTESFQMRGLILGLGAYI